MRKSHPISREQLEQLTATASVLEQDERGVKVFELQSGDILKIFRVRHKFSAARFYSYARRFCRNAERLQKLSIPTVGIKQLLQLEHPGEMAVLYMPLTGQTLRELLSKRSLSVEEARNLGRFIARLHRRGVHFRSLHLGNIILGEDGTLGLIDIADMSIYPWRLLCSTRARNFTHLHRYPAHLRELGTQIWQLIIDSYFEEARLGAPCEVSLRLHLAKLSVFASS